MVKMTVVIIPTKLVARRKTVHVQPVNLLATTVNASIIISYATKSLIVLMNPTNPYIVMSMNAQRLKFTSADINALIL